LQLGLLRLVEREVLAQLECITRGEGRLVLFRADRVLFGELARLMVPWEWK
jgi:hypothetical protein